MTNDAFCRTLQSIFPDERWPKPLHVIQGIIAVEGGASIDEARREVGTTRKVLEQALQAQDPVAHILGMPVSGISEERLLRATRMLGQLLLGRCAEMVFEEMFRVEMDGEETELRDLRKSRTDTDYRLFDRQGRPVYRLNIKFHGARFKRAEEYVSLDPEDTFALATYKIHGALQKQEQEGLPYIFVVVGDSELSGEAVGASLPDELVSSSALIHQAPKGKHKRDFEDAAVESVIAAGNPVFYLTERAIQKADWYVLSARRADKLLRELLFDRVFALRVRNFAQVFMRAELDMHFSLSQDLTPLDRFLHVLKDEGMQKTTALLERGDF